MRRWDILGLHFPITSSRKLLRSRSWLAAQLGRSDALIVSILNTTLFSTGTYTINIVMMLIHLDLFFHEFCVLSMERL